MYQLRESTKEDRFRATLLAPLDYLATLRGEVAPKGAIRTHWVSGADSPDDIVWTSELFAILLSKHARLILEDVTGWTSYPVDLRGPTGRSIDDYHLLAVRGRCGPIDFSRSEIVQKKYPRGIFSEYRGIFFDLDSWDKSGVFMPANRIGTIFVSESAKSALLQLGDSNLELEPLESVQWDEETKTAVERKNAR